MRLAEGSARCLRCISTTMDSTREGRLSRVMSLRDPESPLALGAITENTNAIGGMLTRHCAGLRHQRPDEAALTRYAATTTTLTLVNPPEPVARI
jgi:hypothetical protein